MTFTEGNTTVSVSEIDNRNGKECWIHDLSGEGMAAVRLLIKARHQAKEWGYDEVWANVNNPKLAMILRDHGWDLEQVILKGRTK